LLFRLFQALSSRAASQIKQATAKQPEENQCEPGAGEGISSNGHADRIHTLTSRVNQCEFLAVAPNSLLNWEMMRMILEVDGFQFGLLAMEWMLEAGAFFV